MSGPGEIPDDNHAAETGDAEFWEAAAQGGDELSAELREILARMPVEPGVYIMKDKKGKVIYVGKARSLRSRVRSYFSHGGDSRAFVHLLGRVLGDIESVVVNNEKEALLLENNLIKQHQPRFNVKLVDDKNYLVLRLDPAARFPRLQVVRRMGTDDARYFGPYHSATSCRQTLHVVNRHFKLRTCSDRVLDSRKRPCLQFQIKRCDAPCVFPIAAEVYAEQVRDVALFLEGKDQELIDRLRGRMKESAGREEFEVAASLRDQIVALEKTLTEQRVVSEDQRDQDVVGFHREGGSVEIAVLHIRLGKLLGRQTFSFGGQEFPDDEIVSSFVSLYYDLGAFIPDEVLLPCSIEDAEVKAEWLRERRGGLADESGKSRRAGRAVEVLAPQRGPRVKLVELATKNAQASFVSRRDHSRDAEDALGKMQERLGLKRLPRRIECYDVSHIQGAATVASMVVFLDGQPAKAEYRRFKVKSVTNDDYAAMYEVLSRRFRRSLKGAPHAAAGDADSKWPLPDLVVIDGGKGQLSTAMAALRDVGVDTGPGGIDVMGLAKDKVEADEPTADAPATATGTDKVAAMQHDSGGARPGQPGGPKKTRWRRGRGGPRQEGEHSRPDRVFLPRIKDSIPLRPNTAELFVLSRIRDEAHRFAITYHRQLRGKRTLRSTLGDIPGVGERRQRELLRALGSVKRVREATVDELAALPGMSRRAAEAIRAFFASQVNALPAPPSAVAADARADHLFSEADESAADPGFAGEQSPADEQLAADEEMAADAEDVIEDAATEELRLLDGDEPIADEALEPDAARRPASDPSTD